MINYIETASGKKFNFINIDESQIDIKDIAYSLSNQSRFAGHVPFFSVAEHSVAVAARLHPSLQLGGLLHDAAEAYLSDVPGPIKAFLPDYKRMEDAIQAAIYKKFNVELTEEQKATIKQADKDQTANECHYLLPSKGKDWNSVLFQPDPKFRPRHCPPPEAVEMFMYWFSSLTNSTIEQQLLVVPG